VNRENNVVETAVLMQLLRQQFDLVDCSTPEASLERATLLRENHLPGSSRPGGLEPVEIDTAGEQVSILVLAVPYHSSTSTRT
jgi:hypothetical protein